MKTFSVIAFLFLATAFISCSHHTSNQTNTGFKSNDTAHFFSGSYYFSETESMHTVVMLLPDSLYLILKRVNDQVQWQANAGNWSFQNDQLLLDGGNQSRLLAKWTENHLEVLSNSGDPILKDEKFQLSEITADSASKLSFSIPGAYRWFADAASMRFCNAKRVMPVLMTKANLEAEKHFLSHREATNQEDLFMEIEASLMQNKNTESKFKSALEIQNIKQTFPMMECY